MAGPRQSGPLPDPPEMTLALRHHIAAHNRHATLLALVTAVASVALWAALYGVAHWLTLLLVTVITDGASGVPEGFGVVFLTAAAGLLAYAWVDRRLTPDARPRDQKTPGEIAQDFILALPRATLSISSTLSARQRLSRDELQQAAAFLLRLAGTERLPVQAAGSDLPVASERERVLLALQITGLIDVLHTRIGSTVSLSARVPAALRLRPAAGGDVPSD